MQTVHVDAVLTSDELLRAAGRLRLSELDRFVARVIALRAERVAPVASEAEAGVLLRISRGLPPEARARYTDLKAKRDAETLTVEEHGELLRLTDDVEKIQAERIEALAELARLRGMGLTEVMADLGIRPSSDA